MKKKSIWNRSGGAMILLAAAGVLLMGSAVGSTQAALTYYSENYTAQMEIYDIGVTLNETSSVGTKKISSRDYAGSGNKWNETQGKLLEDMLKESDGKLLLGKKYKEELTVANSGNMDEYVRVSIYRSWRLEDGSKETTLGPSLIILDMENSGWIVDQKASTEERTVLYWPKVLKVGETTDPFIRGIQIDSKIGTKVIESVETSNGYTTITSVFAYDGVRFTLEAEADAVQTHNAAEAIKSAWGADAEIDADGTLRLR